MAAHVLHIGIDQCHRVAVLRSVGYRVDECASMVQLATALKKTEDAQALFLTECEDISPGEAVTLARRHTAAPVIFFPKSNYGSSEDGFDLVIQPLTAPEKWLSEVDTLLAWSRAVRANAQVLMDQTRALRRESSQVRRGSEKEREHGVLERARNSGASPSDPWTPAGSH